MAIAVWQGKYSHGMFQTAVRKNRVFKPHNRLVLQWTGNSFCSGCSKLWLSCCSMTGKGTAPQQNIMWRCAPLCFVYSALWTAAEASRRETFTAWMFGKSGCSGLSIASYSAINHSSTLAVTRSLACNGMWSPGVRYCSLKGLWINSFLSGNSSCWILCCQVNCSKEDTQLVSYCVWLQQNFAQVSVRLHRSILRTAFDLQLEL